jgi:EmrB/QacA subfamily drug resistance transporter
LEAALNRTILSRPGWHIGVVGLGIFLAALDQTVVVTALPPIATDLNIPVTELDKAAWVVTAYLLGYTVALPLMGRVADLYGQRRVYLLSLGMFMVGSLLCARAENLGWLIAARALQAVGGGAVLPVGMAMARHLFEGRRVPFVLGLLGAVAEAGGVIGPLWGAGVMKNLDGVLGVAGWRWIFWVNIPLGLLFGALVLATPRIPRFAGKVDWPGAALLGLGLLALSLGLSTPGSVGAWVGLDTARSGGDASLLTPQGVGLLFTAVVLFALFAWRERYAPDPLVPLELFARRNWPFAAANLTNALVGAALIITMVNTPLYVASVVDGTAEQGGLMLLRMTAFIPLGAIAGGLLGVRVEYRWVAMAGLLVAAAGFWEMSGWSVTSVDDPATWLGLALNGLGFGLLISPVTATALQWGGRGRAALSAALVNVARMVGAMVSLSAVTAFGLRHFQSLMRAHPAFLAALPGESAEALAARQAAYTATEYPVYYKAASLEVYTGAFMIAAVVCVVAIGFAVWLRRNPGSDIEAGPIF